MRARQGVASFEDEAGDAGDAHLVGEREVFHHLLAALFALWHVLTRTEVLPPFFFGEPLVVIE